MRDATPKDVQVIILAGGQGKRMQCDLPKVLVPMKERPLIDYVLSAVHQSAVDPRPLVIVGYGKEAVIRHLPRNMRTVWQREQGGTGHAVRCCRPVLEGICSTVLVLYGDMPFILPSTIHRVVEEHRRARTALTMATIIVPDFNEWRSSLADYGRVLRDASDNVSDIREVRDATPEILAIREVNPSYFCFDASWLWSALMRLQPTNAQKELYLTDLVRLARADGHAIATVVADAREGIGINTREQLVLAERLADGLGSRDGGSTSA